MRKHVLGFAVVALAAAVGGAGCKNRPAPKGDPHLVTMEGALGSDLVAEAVPGEVVARFHIEGKALGKRGRQPVNLVLVIDTSGSMEGEPIASARTAAARLVDLLADDDHLAVVAFDSRVTVVAQNGVLRGRRGKIKKAIAAIEARGTTDLAGGMSTALSEAMRGLLPGGVNRIVLLGDGVANDPTQLAGIAAGAGQQGIAISALGLGLDYDETQLGALATASGGAFHYIREPAEVEDVFTEEVTRLHRAVAHNVQLVLTPGPGVVITRVAGLPQPPSGPAYYTLGDLAEGEQRDVIVRMTTPAKTRGSIELVDAVLAFDDAARGAGRFERRAYLSVKPTADQAALKAGQHVDVLRAAAHAQAADDVLRALELARAGDELGARVLLDGSEAAARSASTALNDQTLFMRAENTRALNIALPQARLAKGNGSASVGGLAGGGAGGIQAASSGEYRPRGPMIAGRIPAAEPEVTTQGATAATPQVAPAMAPVAADPVAADLVRKAHDEANGVLQTRKK